MSFNLFDPSTWSFQSAGDAFLEEAKGMFITTTEGYDASSGTQSINWDGIGKAGSFLGSAYTAITAYGNAKNAGDAAAESLALEKMLAITNKDLALAGFKLQQDAFTASLAIEAKKMGYWEEAQTLNKTIADTKFSWYKKLQPFALDKERYDKALRTNNLDVLEAQTAHVQEVLLNAGDELDDVYQDQSQIYTDQRTSLEDYETRVLGAIERIGDREQISNDDIMRDYGMLYEENMGELNNLIDRVNTRGYAENYNNGMSRSTIEEDRSRDLTKKYYDEVMKTKNASYDQAIARNTSKDNLFNTNRSGILSEAGNSSIMDAQTKAFSTGNNLMGNAETVRRADYDFADSLNQLKNGQMINAGAGSPTGFTSAAPTGSTYNSGASSLLNQAADGAKSMTGTYAGLASANAKTQGTAGSDAFDLFINSMKNKSTT